MDADHIVLHAIFHGQVQGVGFRAAAQRHAIGLRLSGNAENLPDGTVEVYVKGNRHQVDLFLRQLQSNPGHGIITHVDINYSLRDIPFNSFI